MNYGYFEVRNMVQMLLEHKFCTKIQHKYVFGTKHKLQRTSKQCKNVQLKNICFGLIIKIHFSFSTFY